VKVRSRKADAASQSAGHWSWVFRSSPCCQFALVGAIYLGVASGMRRFFFENPDYRLASIEVQTDGTLAARPDS
jgi:hypothetical protein